MSSLDVRDMLDLPSRAGPRPSKKQKAVHPRPNLKGLQREVQSLGGDNPIAIVPAVPLFKKRRLASRKPAARWELRPFGNSARGDDLVLRHWRRRAEGKEETKDEEKLEDSMFAKFNVQIDVPHYEDEQYERELKSEEWTKEETDYLMGVVRDFDLRWPVIWDRYEYTPGPPPGAEADSQALIPEVKPRSMEDLKARYYEVAAKMMAIHRPVQYMSQVEFSLHQLMSSFNPQQEVLRKRFAEAAMSRSPEDRKEEENLLIELKRIMARTERLNEERKDLYARLEAPPSTSNVGIYTTSAGLQQLVQQLMTADKSKKRKAILGPEATPVSATAAAAPADRRDSAVREAPAPTPTPAAAKKGPPGPVERKKLSDEEMAVFGVSRHERLQSGPQFRHEKVSKMINGRSAVVAGRMNNILTELEVPARLVMPTQEVTREFEGLLASIITLLDTRKVGDKLDAEIKVAEAQRAERERRERKERGEGEEEKAGEETEGVVKAEEGEKVQVPAAAGKAAGVHKRSASVLSQVSDKSTKRQKK